VRVLRVLAGTNKEPEKVAVLWLGGKELVTDPTYIASGAQLSQCSFCNTPANCFPYRDFFGYPIKVKPAIIPPERSNSLNLWPIRLE
jgi:hypothetical protein